MPANARVPERVAAQVVRRRRAQRRLARGARMLRGDRVEDEVLLEPERGLRRTIGCSLAASRRRSRA